MSALISEATRRRDEIAATGAALAALRLTPGSSGNLSVRLDDGSLLLTPTNVALGELDPGRLAHLDAAGQHLSGDRPTKEAFLHSCIYCRRPSANAVVHLHSTHAVALSVLDGLDPDDVLPPLTAYYVMKVGRLPLVPYFPPGDRALAGAVEALAGRHASVLLANHGPVVSAGNLREARFAAEELEETARLFLLVGERKFRPLSEDAAAALRPAEPGL